jgi:hypothetical protein
MQKYNIEWKLNYWGDDPGDASEYVNIQDGRVVICDPNEICDFFNEHSDVSKFMSENGVLMWNDVGGAVMVDNDVIIIGDYEELSVGHVLLDEIGGDTGATIAFSIHKAKSNILDLIPKKLILKGVPNGMYRPYISDSPYVRILAK